MQSGVAEGVPVKTMQFSGEEKRKKVGGLTQHDYVVSVGSAGQAAGHVCEILESSVALGHSAVYISGRLEGGLITDLAGSTDWIGLEDTFYEILGGKHPTHL